MSRLGTLPSPRRREGAHLKRLAGILIALVVAGFAAPLISPASAGQATPSGQHPNLQGIWQALNTADWDIQDHGAQLGVPGGRGIVNGNEIPYQTWALAKKQENYQRRQTADPNTKCYLPGVPRIMYLPYPFQIVQTDDMVTILYEYIHAIRYIHTNGIPHPKGHIDWWMGDSRGHWDGNTLVVDVVDFNEDTWFDHAGNFHSDALHIVERFTPAGPDHLTYEATIEDPNVFTRPWTISFPLYRRQEKNMTLLEYECYAYKLEQDWGAAGTAESNQPR